MKKDIKTLLSHVEQKLIKRMHEKPSKRTLDHLALFVGFQDWDSFQKELHEGEDMLNDDENHNDDENGDGDNDNGNNKKQNK